MTAKKSTKTGKTFRGGGGGGFFWLARIYIPVMFFNPVDISICVPGQITLLKLMPVFLHNIITWTDKLSG